MTRRKSFTITDSYKQQYEKLPIRYVCKDCLRTFKDEIYMPTYTCWDCGGRLVAIERHMGVVSEER